MAENTDDKAKAKAKEVPKEVVSHYVKCEGFRTIHADGAIGGITPAGLFHISLYAERSPIPQLIRHKVTPEGKLGKEIDRQGRPGLFRELQVDAIMTIQAARVLSEWLKKQLALIDKMEKEKKA